MQKKLTDIFLTSELQRLCERYELAFGEDFFDLSEEFSRILLDWNRTHSLTTFKSSSELAQNIFNSIYPVKFLPEFGRCMDVGSGAGFPAIPMAIALSSSEFVLVESKGKKYAFLEYVKISLGLKNVKVIKDRVENINDKFDLITSRAVGSRETLEAITKNARDEKTKILLFKGEKEIAKEETSDNMSRIFQMPFGNYILIGD